MALSTLDVLLFYPNIIGFARVFLAFASFYYMPTQVYIFFAYFIDIYLYYGCIFMCVIREKYDMEYAEYTRGGGGGIVRAGGTSACV